MRKLMFVFIILLSFAALSWGDILAQIPETPVQKYGRLQACSVGNICSSGGMVSAPLKGVSLGWSNTGWESSAFFNATTVNAMVEDWKAEVIRVPMGYAATIGEGEYSGSYLDDPAGNMARVKAAIDAAIAKGVYVIIDWHTHSAHLNQADAIAYFDEMADLYGNHENVIFEIFNEPLDIPWTDIKAYALPVIAKIREYSSNLILVGTPNYDQDIQIVINSPIQDSNIAYVAHFYAYSHPLHDQLWTSNDDISSLAQRINIVRAANLSVFVSEFGTTHADGGVKDGQDCVYWPTEVCTPANHYNTHSVANTNAWLSFLASNNIPAVAWNVNNKTEGSAFFGIEGSISGVLPASYTDTTLMTASGKHIYSWLTGVEIGGGDPGTGEEPGLCKDSQGRQLTCAWGTGCGNIDTRYGNISTCAAAIENCFLYSSGLFVSEEEAKGDGSPCEGTRISSLEDLNLEPGSATYSLWNVDEGSGYITAIGPTTPGVLYGYGGNDVSSVNMPNVDNGIWMQEQQGRVVMTTVGTSSTVSGVGFNFLEPEAAFNPKENGNTLGISLCYMSEKDMQIELKPIPGNKYQWSTYIVTLPAANTPTHRKIAWIQFERAWNVTGMPALDGYLNDVSGVHFKFDGKGNNRNVFYMGGVGWYNDANADYCAELLPSGITSLTQQETCDAESGIWENGICRIPVTAIDDFANNTSLAKTGEYWFATIAQNGNATATMDSEQLIIRDSLAEISGVNLEVPTWDDWAQAAIELPAANNGVAYNLAQCSNGFRYKYKGNAHRFNVNSRYNSLDVSYYKDNPLATNWATVTVQKNSFVRDEYDAAYNNYSNIPLDFGETKRFTWVIRPYNVPFSISNGYLQIKDFECFGDLDLSNVSTMSEEEICIAKPGHVWTGSDCRTPEQICEADTTKIWQYEQCASVLSGKLWGASQTGFEGVRAKTPSSSETGGYWWGVTDTASQGDIKIKRELNNEWVNFAVPGTSVEGIDSNGMHLKFVTAPSQNSNNPPWAAAAFNFKESNNVVESENISGASGYCISYASDGPVNLMLGWDESTHKSNMPFYTLPAKTNGGAPVVINWSQFRQESGWDSVPNFIEIAITQARSLRLMVKNTSTTSAKEVNFVLTELGWGNSCTAQAPALVPEVCKRDNEQLYCQWDTGCFNINSDPLNSLGYGIKTCTDLIKDCNSGGTLFSGVDPASLGKAECEGGTYISGKLPPQQACEEEGNFWDNGECKDYDRLGEECWDSGMVWEDDDKICRHITKDECEADNNLWAAGECHNINDSRCRDSQNRPLSCEYTYNNNDPDDDRCWNIDSVWSWPKKPNNGGSYTCEQHITNCLVGGGTLYANAIEPDNGGRGLCGNANKVQVTDITPNTANMPGACLNPNTGNALHCQWGNDGCWTLNDTEEPCEKRIADCRAADGLYEGIPAALYLQGEGKQCVELGGTKVSNDLSSSSSEDTSSSSSSGGFIYVTGIAVSQLDSAASMGVSVGNKVQIGWPVVLPIDATNRNNYIEWNVSGPATIGAAPYMPPEVYEVTFTDLGIATITATIIDGLCQTPSMITEPLEECVYIQHWYVNVSGGGNPPVYYTGKLWEPNTNTNPALQVKVPEVVDCYGLGSNACYTLGGFWFGWNYGDASVELYRESAYQIFGNSTGLVDEYDGSSLIGEDGMRLKFSLAAPLVSYEPTIAGIGFSWKGGNGNTENISGAQGLCLVYEADASGVEVELGWNDSLGFDTWFAQLPDTYGFRVIDLPWSAFHKAGWDVSGKSLEIALTQAQALKIKYRNSEPKQKDVNFTLREIGWLGSCELPSGGSSSSEGTSSSSSLEQSSSSSSYNLTGLGNCTLRDNRLVTGNDHVWVQEMAYNNQTYTSVLKIWEDGTVVMKPIYGSNVSGEWATGNNFSLYIMNNSGVRTKYIYYVRSDSSITLIPENDIPGVWVYKPVDEVSGASSIVKPTSNYRKPEEIVPAGSIVDMSNSPLIGKDSRLIVAQSLSSGQAWVQDNVAAGLGGTHRYRFDYTNDTARFVVWDVGINASVTISAGKWFTIDNTFLRIIGSNGRHYDYLYNISADGNNHYHISLQGYEVGDFRMFTKMDVSSIPNWREPTMEPYATAANGGAVPIGGECSTGLSSSSSSIGGNSSSSSSFINPNIACSMSGGYCQQLESVEQCTSWGGVVVASCPSGSSSSAITPSSSSSIPSDSGTTWTSSKIQHYNGYDYELWNQDNSGTVSMTLTGDDGFGANAKGGTFEAIWSGTADVILGSGKRWGTSSTATVASLGNISIDFAAAWYSTDNAKWLGVYGWAFYAPESVPANFSNQIEYYIIQDRGSYNMASIGTKYGEATIDSIVYEFWVVDRIGMPMLTGIGNYKQYFSMPKNTSSHRTSGIVSVSKHFEEWDKVGMKIDGPLYEVATKVESYTGISKSGNGSVNVTKNILTITPFDLPSSSSVEQSSSSTPQEICEAEGNVWDNGVCKTPAEIARDACLAAGNIWNNGVCVKQLLVTWSEQREFIYNKMVQSPTATLSDPNVEFRIANVFSGAGVYTARIQLVDSNASSYELINDTVSYEIRKKVLRPYFNILQKDFEISTGKDTIVVPYEVFSDSITLHDVLLSSIAYDGFATDNKGESDSTSVLNGRPSISIANVSGEKVATIITENISADNYSLTRPVVQIISGPIPVTGIQISIPETVIVGDAIQYSNARVMPTSATNKAITWTVNGAKMEGSKFIFDSVGTATITATIIYGLSRKTDYTNTWTVTVLNAPEEPKPFISVDSMAILANNLPQTVDFTDAIPVPTITVLPDSATNKAITWAAVGATITDSSIVFDQPIAMATIYAVVVGGLETGNFVKTWNVMVNTGEPVETKPQFIAVGNMQLNILDSAIIGEKIQLGNTKILPTNATNNQINWLVSGATLDGEVIDLTRAGRVTITASIPCGISDDGINCVDYTKSWTITVAEPAVKGPEHIAVDSIRTFFPKFAAKGDLIYLGVERAMPTNATNRSIKWAVENATLEGNVISFTNGGIAKIIATIENGIAVDSNYRQTWEIAVSAPVTYSVTLMLPELEPLVYSYEAGDLITVLANAFPHGSQFKRWRITSKNKLVTLDSVNLDSPILAFSMPKMDLEIQVIYEKVMEYEVLISGGIATKEFYKPKETVSINPTVPAGYGFSYWDIFPTGVLDVDNRKDSLQFNMPETDLMFRAVFATIDEDKSRGVVIEIADIIESANVDEWTTTILGENTKIEAMEDGDGSITITAVIDEDGFAAIETDVSPNAAESDSIRIEYSASGQWRLYLDIPGVPYSEGYYVLLEGNGLEQPHSAPPIMQLFAYSLFEDTPLPAPQPSSGAQSMTKTFSLSDFTNDLNEGMDTVIARRVTGMSFTPVTGEGTTEATLILTKLESVMESESAEKKACLEAGNAWDDGICKTSAQQTCEANKNVWEDETCKIPTQVICESAGSTWDGGICKTPARLECEADETTTWVDGVCKLKVYIAKEDCEAKDGHKWEDSQCKTPTQIARDACEATTGNKWDNGICKTSAQQTCEADNNVWTNGTCKVPAQVTCETNGNTWDGGICKTPARLECEAKKFAWEDGECKDPSQTNIRRPQIAMSDIQATVLGKSIMLVNLPEGSKVGIYNVKGNAIYTGTGSGTKRIDKVAAGAYIIHITAPGVNYSKVVSIQK